MGSFSPSPTRTGLKVEAVEVELSVPLACIRQLESSRSKSLEDLGRVIRPAHPLQEPDVVRAIAAQRILTLVGIVDVLPRLERADFLSVFRDVTQNIIVQRVNVLRLRRIVPHEHGQKEDVVVGITVQAKHVAASLETAVREDPRQRLELCLGRQVLGRLGIVEVRLEHSFDNLGDFGEDGEVGREAGGTEEVVEIPRQLEFIGQIALVGHTERVRHRFADRLIKGEVFERLRERVGRIFRVLRGVVWLFRGVAGVFVNAQLGDAVVRGSVEPYLDQRAKGIGDDLVGEVYERLDGGKDSVKSVVGGNASPERPAREGDDVEP